METVSSCPFCEKNNTKKTSEGNAHFIECLTCKARGPVAYNDDIYEGIDAAILLWNMPQRAETKNRTLTCNDCGDSATVLFDDTPLCSKHLQVHSSPLTNGERSMARSSAIASGDSR